MDLPGKKEHVGVAPLPDETAKTEVSSVVQTNAAAQDTHEYVDPNTSGEVGPFVQKVNHEKALSQQAPAAGVVLRGPTALHESIIPTVPAVPTPTIKTINTDSLRYRLNPTVSSITGVDASAMLERKNRDRAELVRKAA